MDTNRYQNDPRFDEPQPEDVKEPLTTGEREAAEEVYTRSAFDYSSNPIGSRDWTLFLSGWCARAVLASPAQAARRSAWLPIESLPNGRMVDLWIKSRNNPDYGRRAVDVWLIHGRWFGDRPPEEEYGEYASHWMPAAVDPDLAELTNQRRGGG